jgi:hypothetical protein
VVNAFKAKHGEIEPPRRQVHQENAERRKRSGNQGKPGINSLFFPLRELGVLAVQFFG